MPQSADKYVMGRTSGETRRLGLQGMLYADHTDDLLITAGIRKGMRVLDVGCGVGDVTLQVARLVGPGGSVIGVDQDLELLDVARKRAVQEATDNVLFEHHDIQDLAFTGQFDAVAGRLILMHLDDPVSTVRSVAELVRPGGVITFQDFIASESNTRPSLPLFAECARWVTDVLRISGRNPDIGDSLRQIFAQAGLQAQVARRTPMFSYLQPEIIDFTVSTINSVADLIVENQLATYQEIASRNLTDRLDKELTAARAEIFLPTLAAAWAIR